MLYLEYLKYFDRHDNFIIMYAIFKNIMFINTRPLFFKLFIFIMLFPTLLSFREHQGEHQNSSLCLSSLSIPLKYITSLNLNFLSVQRE